MKKANEIGLVFSEDFKEPDFDRIFGECLEDELVGRGFSVRLPSFTDWGYVFRITYGKFDFDIIVSKADMSGNTLSVSIDSARGRLKKMFSSDDTDARAALARCIRDALDNDTFAGKRSWPFFVKG